MSKNQKIIFSFIILFIGLFIFASEYFNSKKIAVYDYMNELYYNEEISVADIEEIEEQTTTNVVENNKEESKEDTSYTFDKNENKSIYIGYLNIPDINLRKGFTEKESKYNTVSKNIEILSASDYPDKENGNVIFAAHSGNSSVSYFKKLHLINKGAQVYIEYNGVTYTYKITDIYTVAKTGKAEIKRKKGVSSITLITCTKNDSSTQTIYIGELINKG